MDGVTAINALANVPVELIRMNPDNIRDTLGSTDLDELQASIRQHGILEPLVVQIDSDGQGYILRAGHRRYRAACRAGLKVVPCIIRAPKDKAVILEQMLVENLHRRPLSPMEEARAYKKLIDEYGLTQTQLAKAVGKSAPSISQRLALLELPPEDQDALQSRRITLGQAREKVFHQRGAKHHYTGWHFSSEHPLSAEARQLCTHDARILGTVACGACWEEVIRADERCKLQSPTRDTTAGLASA
jgi:ParB family chromosome partitioning protein